jgi:alcohol-forming fatty acyl-CoA reductase
LKIIKGMGVLSYFVSRNFEFRTTKLQELFDELGDEDRITFNFNHKQIDPEKYCDTFFLGIRRFLLKEHDSTMPEAQKKLKKLFYLDWALKVLSTIALVLWILKSII